MLLEYKFNIYEMFLAVRKVNSLNQVTMSERLGVVQSTISKIEKGYFEDIPFQLVADLCTRFNLPISSFQNHLFTKKAPNDFLKKVDKGADKVLSAKTVYFVLKIMQELGDEKVFKDLKTPAAIFSFSQSKYSLDFLYQAYNRNTNLFQQAVEIVYSSVTEKSNFGQDDLPSNEETKFSNDFKAIARQLLSCNANISSELEVNLVETEKVTIHS